MFGPQVLRTLNSRRAGAQVGEEATIALNVLLDDAGRAYGPAGLSRSPQSARESNCKAARLQVDEIDEHATAIGCLDGEPQAEDGI
jgi:hypothetical protein